METIMYAYIPSYLFSSANGYHPYDQLERKKKKESAVIQLKVSLLQLTWGSERGWLTQRHPQKVAVPGFKPMSFEATNSTFISWSWWSKVTTI